MTEEKEKAKKAKEKETKQKAPSCQLCQCSNVKSVTECTGFVLSWGLIHTVQVAVNGLVQFTAYSTTFEGIAEVPFSLT